MIDTTLHPLARDYLKQLDRLARPSLPRSLRKELLDQIGGHLAETATAAASEADVRAALDRLGSPEVIVAEAAPAERVRRRGPHEWFAIVGLLLGGLVIPLVGWFVGVILLWTSRAWSTRDKLVGTLVVPGGFAAAAFVGLAGTSSGSACAGSACASRSGGVSTAHVIGGVVLVALLVAPIFTAIYLAVRAEPRPV